MKHFESMNRDRFAQRIEEQQGRLAQLYSKTGNHQRSNSDSVAPAPNFLKEIGVASEELQVALEELHYQNEELIAARQALEAERQRYHDLFEFAPDSYLVTDTAGKILEANSAAANMLNVAKNFLIGKPLAVFIPVVERQHFWSALTGLQQAVGGYPGTAGIIRQEWVEFLQPRHAEPIPVVLSVVLVCKADLNGHTCASQVQSSSWTDRGLPAASPLETTVEHPHGTNPWLPAAEISSPPCTLRWLLRTVTTTAHWQATCERGTAPLQAKGPILVSASLDERQRQTYHAGEIIPLNPQSVWFISQGLVKLSTFASESEEVLLGLAGPGTAFAPGLTSLLTYQAVALVEVQLIGISLSEIASSPSLAQSLLPQISQRLQQAESLLAIAGMRKVSDRLYQLLLLLKQEIGQPVDQGSWLSVRLTHQDFANACCTTRATVTRQLLRLQQQGRISWCPKRHLILNHDY